MIQSKWLWIFFGFSGFCHLALVSGGTGVIGLSTCPIKLATQYPCPVCGSTRAVVAFYNGDWLDSLYLNPIGFLVVFGFWIILGGLLVDKLRCRGELLSLVQWFDDKLSSNYIKGLLLTLLLANWLWNIAKGF